MAAFGSDSFGERGRQWRRGDSASRVRLLVQSAERKKAVELAELKAQSEEDCKLVEHMKAQMKVPPLSSQ
jgi:hypothetical protein